MLEVKNLNKKFKNVQALNHVSLTVLPGEIVSIIGSSGAGKTTLLRTISGLEKCDSGSIIIEGDIFCSNGQYSKDKNIIKNFRKNLSLVFQNFNLFPHMTVLENIIQAPVNLFNISKEGAQSNALNLLTSLRIADKKDSYPCELSGGQKQRVAIARALALNPKYICFDEPTSALDPKTTKEVAEILKSLSKEERGILIITHDMEFAENVSTRMVEMQNGSMFELKSCGLGKAQGAD